VLDVIMIKQMIFEVTNENHMEELGAKIGALLNGGEMIELVGDVGAGKTTLTRGIARGLDIKDYIQSPSFTINRTYQGRRNIVLSHYDFYRLSEAGLLSDELQEVVEDPKTVVVLEWAEVVDNILPKDRLRIMISSLSDTGREVALTSDGYQGNRVIEGLKS
jgi:tRNA threonylcarbamoyladenosine biosynthesis protein TsaE